MKSFLVSTTHSIDAITERFGVSLAWLNVAMVICMFLVVLLRYAFNHASIPLQETVMYLHGLIFMLGSGFALKHNEHVRVDILYQKLSHKGQAVVNLLGTLLLLIPVASFIIWYSWSYVESAWKIKEISQEADGLAYVYLLKSLIIGLSLSLLIQAIAELCRNICILADIPVNEGQAKGEAL